MELEYVPTSIYWGGGTPTKLVPEELARIGSALKDSFDLSSLQQHSVEVSPETFCVDHIGAMSMAPFDRISIGVQSLQPQHLQRAGRAHSAEQAVAAVEVARHGGITNINIDLISGFPGEQIEEMFDSASRAAMLGVQHISVYPYRPSPGTRMASQIDSGRREPLKLEYMKSSYLCAKETLEKNGFDQYALSYFAKSEEYRSKVSMHIYNLEGYIIGFGSGGHSILGWHRVLNDNGFYDRYIDDPLSFDKCVKFGTEPDQIESLLLRVGAALQTQGGLNFQRFASLTGHSFQKLRRENDATIGFLHHLRLCGAKFVEFDDRFVMESENVHDVYLEHINMLVKYGKLDRGLRV